MVRCGFRMFLRDVPTSAVIEVDAVYAECHYAFDVARLTADLRPFGPVDVLVSLNPWHSEGLDRLFAALRPRRSIGFHPHFGQPLDLDFGKHSSELQVRDGPPARA
jgi:hypothetical protein